MRSRSVNPVREVVRSIEGSVNDVMVATQGNVDGDVGDISSTKRDTDTDMESVSTTTTPRVVSGAEVEKRGGGGDWENALSLGHLETRLTAAVALGSAAEYKQFLVQYAKRLADEGFKGKAEEFVKELLGPVY
jgi:hypothetical protein